MSNFLADRDYAFLGLADAMPAIWGFAPDSPRLFAEGIPADVIIDHFDRNRVVKGSASVTYTDADGQTIVKDDGAYAPVVNQYTGAIYQYVGLAWSGSSADAATDNVTAVDDRWQYGTQARTFLDAVASSGVPNVIASAGTLDHGGKGWIQVQSPDAVGTEFGMTLLPFVNWVASVDGSSRTEFAGGYTRAQCRNTHGMMRTEMRAELQAGRGLAVARTRNGANKITPDGIRAAFDIVMAEAASDAADFGKLADFTVSDAELSAFLQTLYPVKDDASDRVKAAADRNRAAFAGTMRTDERVKEFAGTAFGIWQTADTMAGDAPIRNVTGGNVSKFGRAIRAFNSGDAVKAQTSVLQTLAKSLATTSGRELPVLLAVKSYPLAAL